MFSTSNKLPNLYIPGAGKSGTSTLHDLLNTHPDICMSTMKEPHFWTSPKFDDFKKIDIDTYHNLFTNPNAKYLGESSTGYMSFPNFKERIKEHYNNSPKFIFILRNPVDRIYSHYWWLRGMGSEIDSFKNAVEKDFDTEPRQEFKLPENGYKMYYQFGLYAKWISKFYAEFEKENILIITTESLKQDRLNTINKCYDFLGLPRVESLTTSNSNTTTILRFPLLYKYAKKLAFGEYKFKKILKLFVPIKLRIKINEGIPSLIYSLTKSNKQYPNMSENDRNWTVNLYKEDVSLLKKITGMDFNEWKDFR